MKKSKLPKIDSIEKLAKFWNTHDLTDFEDELKEVPEPVFDRRGGIQVLLNSREAEAIQQMAEKKGVSPEQLVYAWVGYELARRTNGRQNSRSSRK